MRKFLSTIILTSLFATSFDSVKPFVVGEKVAIGSAVTAFVGSAALLTTIICLRNAKKDLSDIEQDFILEKEDLDPIDKQELEKIYSEDEKAPNLISKILGLGLIPSAAIGGGVYWWLSGHTPRKIIKSGEKGFEEVGIELGDLADIDINSGAEKINENINRWARRFGIDSGCSLIEAEKQLKERYKFLNDIKKRIKEVEKGEDPTIKQNIQILNKKIEDLVIKIDLALELIPKDRRYYRQLSRYDKLRKERILKDDIRSGRNHERIRDVMWIWALLNGVGKVASIFSG